ncbi:MAG: hypothetical protein J0L97_01205 [Alphaproteobacteria bacterium]|nr:hypothetical protein [Alphaproteobacteria bacterium]
MKKTLLFLMFLCALPDMSRACSCLDPGPFEDAIKSYDTIFSGTAVSVEKHATTQLIVKFKDVNPWKGTPGKQPSVITEASGGTCGYGFEVGKAYLIYAHRANKDPATTQFNTFLCSPTKLLSSAEEDLKFLKALKP